MQLRTYRSKTPVRGVEVARARDGEGIEVARGRRRRRAGWWAARLVGAAAAAYGAALAVAWSRVRVAGRSMEPALWPGDLLLTVPAQRWLLRPGQVVVVRDGDDPTHLVVKRIAAVTPDGVEVRGDAPDRSTDSRRWGALPARDVRRLVVARWPDVRSPLRRVG